MRTNFRAMAPGNASGQARNTPQNKSRAYLRGFREAAKELGVDPTQGHCPYSILDDPTINPGGAFDLGRADAMAAARARVGT